MLDALRELKRLDRAAASAIRGTEVRAELERRVEAQRVKVRKLADGGGPIV